MRRYRFVTVDVFTNQRFGGNPLAVFPDAAGLSDAEMQALAREFNLSETTFVLPPQDAANTACVRIFTPAYELPFAGHPNVGTGWVLARAGRGEAGLLRFEELAGLVEVRATATGAEIDAPRPLALGETLPAAAIAACAGLEEADIDVTAHPPLIAGVGTDFAIAAVRPEALSRAAPDSAAFRRENAARPHLQRPLAIHLYARAGAAVRTRMFAPLGGVPEDPATGSANLALGALLLSLGTEARASFAVTQGVEMGRPSALRVSAHRAADGIRASVFGECVPVLSGEAEV